MIDVLTPPKHTVPPARAASQPQPTDPWLVRWCAEPGFAGRLQAIQDLGQRRVRSPELAEIWLHLLKKAIAEGVATPSQTEHLIRQFFMLAPNHPKAESLYELLMAGCPEPASAGGIVFMVVSCKRYLAQAQQRLAEYQARGLQACVMIGDPSLPVAETDGAIVHLPVEDTYEALTSKVLEGLTYLRRRHGPVAVAKVDDDTRLAPNFDAARLAQVAHSQHYVGNLWRGAFMDRCFHFGKTSVPIAVYARRAPTLYAGGEAYLLGPRAVEHLVREWTFYPGEFAGQLYEDRGIAEALRHAGIEPHGMGYGEMGFERNELERFVSRG